MHCWGVATPGDLIRNKTQTPFNIGEAIELNGFQIGEVEALIEGLRGKVNNPQGVMRSILDWTGGQPFLSQKLCKFMVETYHGTSLDYSNLVKEVVRTRIIDNWESQDDPEHLRTIRDRILCNEQRAGYLLELYQQIQEQGEVVANNSVESSELRLSGLVVKREGKLRVYNRVYQLVFDRSWVEVQLRNLRPYSEAFRAWVDSGYSDESRLLRGNALADAEEWAKDRNLNQYKQFLLASRDKEIQEKIAVEEQAARLERERKDKEAAEQRNQVLSEANKKAKKLIRNGTVVLILALLGAVGLGVFAAIKGHEVSEWQKKVSESQKKVIKLRRQAEEATEKAKAEQLKAQQAGKNAEEATEKAEAEQLKAQQAEKNAKEATKQFIGLQRQAEEATEKAEAEQLKAQQAEKNAEEATKKVKELQQQSDNLQNKLNLANQEIKKLEEEVFKLDQN